MSPRTRIEFLLFGALALPLLFAPTAHSGERNAFDGYPLVFEGMDPAERHRVRKENAADPRPTEEGAVEAPGGGGRPAAPPDPPLVSVDAAVPPPEIALATSTGVPKTDPAPKAKSEERTVGSSEPIAVEALPTAATFLNGTPAVNRLQDELASLEFEPQEPPRMAFDPRMVQGEFVQSKDNMAGARRLHVQYDFHTVIRFANGERPTGMILCGSCPKEGDVEQMTALDVEHVGDVVVVKPRVYSTPEHGVVSSNISVETETTQGRKRLYMFTAIEISGLLDRDGKPLRRTDYHEVRGAAGGGSSVVEDTFQSRVSEAADQIEAQYQRVLAKKEDELLGAKAHEGVEVYTEFDTIKKHGARRLDIESAVTIGDETVVKMRLVGATELAGDPVVFLQEEDDKLRILRTKSTLSTKGEFKGKPALYITVTLQGVKLLEEQRIVVAVVDGQRREEFRASAGRA